MVPGEEGRWKRFAEETSRLGAGRGVVGVSEVGGLGALGLFEALEFHSSSSSSLFFDNANCTLNSALFSKLAGALLPELWLL
jgi:hypothetical protein